MGRPSKYQSHVKDRLESVLAWKRMGLTDKEIGENLGISQSAMKEYKSSFKAFKAVLKGGKDDANAKVINALFKSAVGYDYYETHEITQTLKDGTEKTFKRRIKKTVPSDKTAMIFWLKNRAFKDWRDRRETAFTDPDGKPLKNVFFVIPDNGMNKDNAD